MRFAVLGAGAIGSYVGALLTRAGLETTLIARGAHLDAMVADGLAILSPRGYFAVRVDATDDFDAIREADVVFVGLKAQSLPALAPEVGSRLSSGARVIFAQNGVPWWYFQQFGGELDGLTLESVDPGGAIAAALPSESVIGSVVYLSTEILRPGVVRHIEGTRIAIGEPGGKVSKQCEEISKALTDASLKCRVDGSLRDQVWLKLIGNVAFNPVSALTRSTMQELGEVPETRALLRSLIDEAVRVGDALGVSLPVSIDRRFEAAFSVGDHRTSMLQDINAGKLLEYDCMTGAVIELAHRLGIEVPNLDGVHALIKAADHSLQGRLTDLPSRPSPGLGERGPVEQGQRNHDDQ